MLDNSNQLQIDYDTPEAAKISGQLDLDLSSDIDSRIPYGTSLSINLEERATHLIDAIENYSKSNSNRGFVEGALKKHPDLASSSNDFDGLEARSRAANRQERNADNSLRSAIGVTAMLGAGYAPDEVSKYEDIVFHGIDDEEEKTDSFRQKYYYDPANDPETDPVKIERKKSAKARLRAKYKEELRTFIPGDKEISF